MTAKQWDSIWLNATIATMTAHQPYGLIKEAALAVKSGQIAWVGPQSELPSAPEKLAAEIHDVKGMCITPGLIDCHTHLVFAGNRVHEFELRLQGATYEQIARAGGGILSTVAATRAVTEDELLQQSLKRAAALIKEGVTTIEIKSGYGLDFETELKMLRVAKRIGEILSVTVVPTFLGAHSIPPEFKENPDDYVDFICQKMIPEIAKHTLAKSVDVFCESIAFNLQQTRKIFSTAQKYQLAVKCHAEQLSSSGAALLAAEYQALSVDHLEHLSEKAVKVIAQSKTVAVLLPGAFYYLRESKIPPIELFRKYRVPMAIATDCNPGTSPVTSLLLMLNMAAIIFGMTPEEAFRGITQHAASALGLSGHYGAIEAGRCADFVIWDIKHPLELVYNVGGNPGVGIVKGGH